METSANAASRSGKAAEELMIGDVAAMPGLNEESFGMSWERHFFSPNASASQERRREIRLRFQLRQIKNKNSPSAYACVSLFNERGCYSKNSRLPPSFSHLRHSDQAQLCATSVPFC